MGASSSTRLCRTIIHLTVADQYARLSERDTSHGAANRYPVRIVTGVLRPCFIVRLRNVLDHWTPCTGCSVRHHNLFRAGQASASRPTLPGRLMGHIWRTECSLIGTPPGGDPKGWSGYRTKDQCVAATRHNHAKRKTTRTTPSASHTLYLITHRFPGSTRPLLYTTIYLPHYSISSFLTRGLAPIFTTR